MSAGSNIEWCEATWNPVVGCTPVSAGCLNCYAATMAKRLGAMGQQRYVDLTIDKPRGGGAKGTRAVFNGTVRCVEEALTIPLGWKKPRRIFVNSMSDLFHDDVPCEFIDGVFAVMALCPQHTFQVLTKRPERMAEYLNQPYMPGRIVDAAIKNKLDNPITNPIPPRVGSLFGESKMLPQPWPLPNVWLGTSCEDQETADLRIPHLLRCPAAIRFLSCEPLLGPIDLRLMHAVLTDLMDLEGRDPRLRGTYPFKSAPANAITRRSHLIRWIIVGGESGPGARPCNVEWIRDIVRQCKAAEVPCFVKQLGARPIAQEGVDYEVSMRVGGGDAYTHAEPSDDFERRRTVVQGPKATVEIETCAVHIEPATGFMGLRDRKGGDPSEWPADLRVREMPR